MLKIGFLFGSQFVCSQTLSHICSSISLRHCQPLINQSMIITPKSFTWSSLLKKLSHWHCLHRLQGLPRQQLRPRLRRGARHRTWKRPSKTFKPCLPRTWKNSITSTNNNDIKAFNNNVNIKGFMPENKSIDACIILLRFSKTIMLSINWAKCWCAENVYSIWDIFWMFINGCPVRL